MRVEAFRAGKGDCLLLTGSDGTRVLVDGGTRPAYRRHIAPALGRIARDGGTLELVCVSHIDQDHIAGVLQMLEDEVAWRVRDFQRRTGNEAFPDPDCPRPPAVARIWHNAFHDVVEDNAGPIEDAVAADAAVLSGGDAERSLAEARRDLALSIREGLRLSHRIGRGHLGIPLNREFGARLAMVRERPKRVRLGSLRLTVIGPFARDVERLRSEWNAWLESHRAAVDRLRERMRKDAAQLGLGEIDRFRQAIELRAHELGERSNVTTPNLASIMLLAEDAGRTVLLTGDGHGRDVLAGLEACGRLNGGGLHVDVLKVQHHGSEHNLDEEFCRRLTADHYVFCANGEHENPDLRVVEAVVRSRTAGGGDGRGFKLWFTSSPETAEHDHARRHMAAVRRLVDDLAAEADGRLAATFLDGASFEVA